MFGRIEPVGCVSAAVLEFSDSHEVDLLSKARLVPRCLNPGLSFEKSKWGKVFGQMEPVGCVSAAVLEFSDSHEVDLLSKARLVPRCLNPGLSFE